MNTNTTTAVDTTNTLRRRYTIGGGRGSNPRSQTIAAQNGGPRDTFITRFNNATNRWEIVSGPYTLNAAKGIEARGRAVKGQEVFRIDRKNAMIHDAEKVHALDRAAQEASR